MKSIDNKRLIAKKALSYIQEGMTVGLGTGSTASCFIEELGKSKLKVVTCASSKASEALALQHNLKLFSPNHFSSLDVTVDGTDEVTPELYLIKGQGGALLREKIIAHISKQLIIICEEAKLSTHLGHSKLALEIVPFGKEWTKQHVEALGYKAAFRTTAANDLFITDNGNNIIDITFTKEILDPFALEQTLQSIPGIVTTGLFLSMATHVVLGRPDGSIHELHR